MKLRIKGNSVRLRLLRSEVERFAAEGSVSEKTSFGSAALTYSIVMKADAETMHASFRNGEIEVIIPERAAKDWATNEQVGLEADSDALSILVEKDFACLDRPDDPDREDSFPNPHTACAPGE